MAQRGQPGAWFRESGAHALTSLLDPHNPGADGGIVGWRGHSNLVLLASDCVTAVATGYVPRGSCSRLLRWSVRQLWRMISKACDSQGTLTCRKCLLG